MYEDDEIVGTEVIIYTEYGDEEVAKVLEDLGNGNLKVVASDGEILIGNQWEPI